MPKVTVLISLALFLVANLAFAQPSPSVVAEPVAYAQALYYNHTSHIARTSDDKLFAVWTSSGTDGQIVASQYDPSFQIWNPAVPISTNPAGGTAHKAGIAADDAGNLYVAWQQRNTSAEDYAIYFSKYDGASWSTPVDLTGTNAENEEVGIAVSDQGNIFIAWNTDAEPDSSEFVLCISSSDGGQTWSSPPDTLSSADGVIGGTSTTSGRPTLARATSGKMVCTWHEEPNGAPNRETYVNQYDGSQWMGETMVADTADAGNTMYPAIGVDSQDNICLITNPQLPLRSLILYKKGWSDPWPAVGDTVVGQGYSGYKPFMGLDANDNIYVVFRRDMENDTTGLEQTSYVTSSDGGATWSGQTRLSRELHDAGYVTLAPRIRAAGVDVLWREGYREMAEDPDTLSVVYGHIDLLPSSIEDNTNEIADRYQLQQNYPNPFNPSTSIYYTIAKKGRYDLSVYNILGQKIATLTSGEILQGSYSIDWYGTDDSGQKVASGIYFYQLQGEGVHLSKKMVYIR